MRTLQELRRAGAPPEIAAVLPRLLAGETPEGVTALKPGSVFRVGELVLKLYPRSANLLARLREPRAQRAARAYARLLPVHSPRPLHWDRLGDARFESLLVYEFVAGPTLLGIWKDRDAEALEALPRLFADLHRIGVLHADLHAKNLIWSAGVWFTLDLDGVRHGLHALRRRTITENIWARLMFDFEDDEAVLELYREFLALVGQPWEAEPSCTRIRDRFDDVLRERGFPARPR